MVDNRAGLGMCISIVVTDIMIVESIHYWGVLVQIPLGGRLEDLVVSKCKLIFARLVSRRVVHVSHVHEEVWLHFTDLVESI